MERLLLTKDQKEEALKSPVVRDLLQAMPAEMGGKLTEGFLGLGNGSETFRCYLEEHSEISRLVKKNSSSGHTFEFLYHNRRPEGFIDEYFLKSRAGHQIYRRLVALEENLPELIRRIYDRKVGKILIDNVASGPGNDMINVLAQNPDLVDKVHVRNIDCDQSILDIGRQKVERLGISHAFEFCCSKVHTAPPRGADMVLLIGVLCPKGLEESENILGFMKFFVRPGGTIVFSTAQQAMGLGDPFTDYIMRMQGWNMAYKTDGESFDLAFKAGWVPDDKLTFHDDLHYHCMVTARMLWR